MSVHSDRPGLRGILAPATRLDAWLQVVLVVMVVTCAARYVDRHGLDAAGAAILVGAACLALLYAARPALAPRTWWPSAWVALIVSVWTALTLVAPSFAWCAVPVAFAVLQVIPFGAATTTVVLMTLVVAGGWLRITDSVDPTLVVGPVGIALVTVVAYRALQREAEARQVLLDELTEAQADLAEEQHRTGALAERARLSREIHDSVGQGLSSINLLLQAAEQSLSADPAKARAHVTTAATTAREGLDEVRRVVRDLAPSELAGDGGAAALPDALRRALAVLGPGVDAEVRVHGDAAPVRPEVAAALVRTARGALANVREHAGATRVVVTLTYHPDEVMIDVRDDGRGFDPGQAIASGLRGRGLSGVRARAVDLDGRADIESAPGEGTTVSVRFPLAVAR